MAEGNVIFVEHDVYQQCVVSTLHTLSQVTSPHLERVRRLKNRLVRLTTRVETVREVLERFLDDDEDMHDLNLTANLEVEEADGTEVEGGSGGVITPHVSSDVVHHDHITIESRKYAHKGIWDLCNTDVYYTVGVL
jgi:hypothetical protein